MPFTFKLSFKSANSFLSFSIDSLILLISIFFLSFSIFCLLSLVNRKEEGKGTLEGRLAGERKEEDLMVEN